MRRDHGSAHWCYSRSTCELISILSPDNYKFPPHTLAEPDGLLAIGGDLSPERLLVAYKNGIFPWSGEGETLQWYSPDPRLVLFPEMLRVSKSMRQIINKDYFSFTFNTAFEEVISACQNIERDGQYGTWIYEELITSFLSLHKRGIAFSAETWRNGKLVGGLYGIKIGKIFFGESMFSYESNASKFAFIRLVEKLRNEGIFLIDCQVQTGHLISMGAEMIDRETFMAFLHKHI